MIPESVTAGLFFDIFFQWLDYKFGTSIQNEPSNAVFPGIRPHALVIVRNRPIKWTAIERLRTTKLTQIWTPTNRDDRPSSGFRFIGTHPWTVRSLISGALKAGLVLVIPP